MKTGDHVYYGKGKKVHVVEKSRNDWVVTTFCGEWVVGLRRVETTFHPTTDPVDCLRCLAKEEK